MPVVRHWFGYRKARPAGLNREVLTGVYTDRWYPEWTSELRLVLEALEVLVALEGPHLGLLDEVMASDLLLDTAFTSSVVRR